ncbi:MAG: anhydro-N-acetylmuramic acid kinase [Candidatus Zixiibacteriota bacterium]|nr:MAG: anhydro-N-acetylmuramic acid kinase [candidate division Zixibacteria bacterium]
MSLGRILRKKGLTVLGLNSGTSADGLDLALVRISLSGNKRAIKFLKGGKRAYGPALRKRLLGVIHSETVALSELIYLDNRLGQVFGQVSKSFLSNLPPGISVDLIASHGQTVRHLPGGFGGMGKLSSGTMQIGSADFIAAIADRIVINDFRQADIALGNEGAPITVAAMEVLFGSDSESRLIVNIGGISNYFYFPSLGGPVGAADCGPGNSLCDILSARFHNERYDHGGRRARRGTICEAIVSRAMTGGFYDSKAISTGREAFGVSACESILAMARQRRLSDNDVMATVSELTVKSIVRKVVPIVRRDKQLTKLYLTGGGRHNIFFIDRLRYHLQDLDILAIDALGIDGDYVEATAYAVMGEACLRSRAMATVFRSGRTQKVRPVLGRITQPPQRSRPT